jgi:hypothetical protein
MKRWGLRILSALLAFTLGLCAAKIMKFRPAPTTKVQPDNRAANIQAPLPPPQVVADARPTEEVEEATQPHPVSISPYEIKRRVDENNLAARRGEEECLDLRPVLEQLGAGPDDSVPCYGTCDAAVFMIELDGKPGRETLLRVDYNSTFTYHYFIFKRNRVQGGKGTEWSLLGDVVSGGWYSGPEDRVEISGTRRWLVVGGVTGHGSGFHSNGERWYEVSEAGVVKVLDYQTRLFAPSFGADAGIDRKTGILKFEHRDGLATLVLWSTTSYAGYIHPEQRFPLWRSRRTATFIKMPGTSKFIFDPLRSEMSEKEFISCYGDCERITDVEFLKYNYRELVRLAARGNAKQKEWLRSYLSTCDESPERRSLQTALGDGQS